MGRLSVFLGVSGGSFLLSASLGLRSDAQIVDMSAVAGLG
jgi:hypothetical protein